MLGAVAAVVVGAVFVVSGAAKLAAPSWVAQAAALGVPTAVARPVPAVELVLGAALVAQLARRPLAVVALVLLCLFSAVVARSLAAGRRPVCACFGQWSSRPIGAATLVRNAVIAAVAVVAAVA
jgi:uncharacterized membrane protein YphA (DoxX/SURF4 family)